MKYITPTTKFYYFIDNKNKPNLEDALISYIENCSNLKRVDDIKLINSNGCLIAIYDEFLFVYLLDFIYKNRIKTSQVRLCGFGKCYDINLCEIQSLKFQIVNGTNSIQEQKVKHIRLIESTLGTLFKGHGEDSLLSYIGKSYYYINNYITLRNGNQEMVALNENFLKPGFANISVLRKKIDEYARYLYFSGWEKELSDIIKILSRIDVGYFETQMLCNSGKFRGDKLMKNISEVERIIKAINKEFNIICDEASGFNC